MAWIQRILVATDFSPGARVAYASAARLAERLDAALDLVYVWQPPSALPLQTPTGKRGKSTLSDVARREASLRMSRFIASSNADRLRLRARIEVGSPHELIVTLAATERHDLIVMGACGSGASQTRLGSITRLVLDTAPCPVLTLRAAPRAGAGQAPSFENPY